MYIKVVGNKKIAFPDVGKSLFLDNLLIENIVLGLEKDITDIKGLIEVEDSSYIPSIEDSTETIEQTLTQLQENQIKLSKLNLSAYLENNPLLSTIKHEEGRYYNVTSEKQQQLTSKLLMATMYAQANMPYNLTWNDTGDICESWELQQLQQLSMQIDAYVTPLVAMQQAIEVKIRECQTQDEVLQINIEFNKETVEKWLVEHE